MDLNLKAMLLNIDEYTILMAFDGRKNIINIDDETCTVFFETWKNKKITGAKIGAILGYDEHKTEFKVACELAGIYPGDKPNKYINAGNTLEPVLLDYIGKNISKLVGDSIVLAEGTKMAVEPPVPKEQCGYDHFHDNKTFGGMVDGYIAINGKRNMILEIKTSSNKEKWLDDSGNVAEIPMSYMLQASLYAELARVDKILFLVGFLKEEDYSAPTRWKPSIENTYLIIKDRLNMKDYMNNAKEWYDEYILNGTTPEWTDKDAELLKYLRAGITW